MPLLTSYLRNRHQQTKVSGIFSVWEELLSDVPQGSVLGPLLFNIYLKNLFYTVEKASICNLADDKAPNASDYNVKKL